MGINVRACGEKALADTHCAHSSDSETSDFTGEEGTATKLCRPSPGGLHVSRHRYTEFNPASVAAAVLPVVLQHVDGSVRCSVFLPDMSASTLNGWCLRTIGEVFSSLCTSGEFDRLFTPSEQWPKSLTVSWVVIFHPGLLQKRRWTGSGQRRQKLYQVMFSSVSEALWAVRYCERVCRRNTLTPLYADQSPLPRMFIMQLVLLSGSVVNYCYILRSINQKLC